MTAWTREKDEAARINNNLNCNGDSSSANSSPMTTRDEELKQRDFGSFGSCEEEGTVATSTRTTVVLMRRRK